MSQTTKRALAASLKKLLSDKPLDKITVTDIAEDCGVNRQTFYYHFQDIYDLVEWIYTSEAHRRHRRQKDLRHLAGGLRPHLPLPSGQSGLRHPHLSLHQPGAPGAVPLSRDLRAPLRGGGGEGGGAVRPGGGQGLHRPLLQVRLRGPGAGLDRGRHEGGAPGDHRPAGAGDPGEHPPGVGAVLHPEKLNFFDTPAPLSGFRTEGFFCLWRETLGGLMIGPWKKTTTL